MTPLEALVLLAIMFVYPVTVTAFAARLIYAGMRRHHAAVEAGTVAFVAAGAILATWALVPLFGYPTSLVLLLAARGVEIAPRRPPLPRAIVIRCDERP